MVVLVGLGIAGVGVLSQTRRYFVNADRRALIVQAQLVANSCDDACLASGRGDLTVSTEQLPAASNVTQSQAIAPSDLEVNVGTPQVSAALPSTIAVYPRGVKVRAADSLALKAFEGQEASSATAQTIVAAVPIRRGKTVVGAVVARGTLRDVNEVLADIRNQLLGAIAVGSVAALAFGLWRARSIAKPLRELTNATQGVAEGRFDQSLPPSRGSAELVQLTQSFDDMRVRVQSELAAREAFVADASHELRTPLTAIRGAVEILESGGVDRPEVRDRFLSTLGRETNRLLALADSLLDLQKADPSPQTQVDLVVLVRSVSDDLTPTANAREVRLRVETTEDYDVSVVGHESRLRQVVVNLVQNAVNHSAPGDDVVLRVGLDAGLAAIDVDDSGPGIPEHDRERVFERFVRLDQARARTSGGAGLGLPIARTIVESHGGTLTLHARSDGKAGTSAHIRLPAVP